MGNTIVDKIIDRRVKRINNYILVLIDGLYKTNYEKNKVLESSIYKYINDFEINNKDPNSIIEGNENFFKNQNINVQEQKVMFTIILDTLTGLEKQIEDISFIDNLNLFSEVMSISFDIENYIDSLKERDVGFNEIIGVIRNKYHPFGNKGLDEKLSSKNLALKKEILDNNKTRIKMDEFEKENPFYLEFYKVCNDEGPPGRIMKAILKKNSSEFDKYKTKKVDEISSVKKIVYEYSFIAIELALEKALQLTFRRIDYGAILIELPPGFIKSKSNRSKILKYTSSVDLRKKICFKIDCGEFETNYDAILEINNAGFAIASGNISNKEMLGDNVKQVANYIFINSNLKKELEEIKKQSGYSNKILLERDIGEGDVMLGL